ncbi:glycosyltransferase family 4 protein [Candidatus Dojkabacteria bacterium]|uniref:Glycosyltransferase family 4 protein n=1 Tax=Candidatus Dojkabacteria bacterium TaxID=2099670 RepID=A0A955LB26_9BACT|nr:glycosyltransferase family 4 protein [Candidatus Dojkabacteria bacterium]
MEEPETKTILIDTTCLFDQYSKRGIGRYTRDLLLRLIKKASADRSIKISLVGFNDLEQNLREIGFSKFGIEEYQDKITFTSLGEPSLSNFKNIRRWKKIDEIIFEEEPDLYFAPHFERGLPTTPSLKHTYMPNKTVVTVHDVIPLVNNSFSQKNPITNFLKGIFYRRMWKGVEGADLVLTSSNFSKDDLIKHGDIPEDNVEVIYLGINESFFAEKIDSIEETTKNEVLNRFVGEGRPSYFFYDSGLESNKGIDNMLSITARLFEKKGEHIPQYLVLVGGDFYQGRGENIKPRSALGEHYLKKIKQLGIIDKVITTSRISDEELQILLRHANTYVYFSEYEGFGFGPIQAMAAEVPAIVNASSCLPEITNGGAFLVDAKEIEDSINKIYDFLKDEQKRKELVNTGKEVALKYNWERTADLVLENFHKLLTETE